MSVIVAIYLVLLVVMAATLIATRNPAWVRSILKIQLALAVVTALVFFGFAARMAVPYPDAGPLPTGHILEGVLAMYRISEFFVASLAIFAISGGIAALRLASASKDAA